MTDYRITSIDELVQICEQHSEYWTNKSIDIQWIPIYRGQADETWKLAPSIVRHPKCDERRIIKKAFGDDFSIDRSLFEVISKLQDYNMPTRFLDFTRDFHVATYFACKDGPNKNENGKLFLCAYDQITPQSTYTQIICHLALIEKSEISVSDFAAEVKRHTELPAEEIENQVRAFCSHGFVVLPSESDYQKAEKEYGNMRLRPQKGCFYVFGNVAQTIRPENLLLGSSYGIIKKEIAPCPRTMTKSDRNKTVVIPCTLKRQVLKWLENEHGINEEKMFPDLRKTASV